MKAWTADDIQHRLGELAHESTDPDVAALRHRILEVATEHFVRFGYRRANIGEIARGVGIGKGSLYRHFDSKETLLIASVAYEKMALVPQVQKVFSLPPDEQLEAYLRMAFNFTMTARLTSRLLRGDREIDRVLSAARKQHVEDEGRSLEMIATLVAGLAPQLSEHQRNELAEMLPALISMPAFLEGSSTLQMRLPTGVFIDRYVTILVRGIAALDAG